MIASLGMKLAQNGSSKEWAVKVSFIQSLTWMDSEFYLREIDLFDFELLGLIQ